MSSTNSTSEDGESTTEDGEGEASSETETGEPLPECVWEPVSEECVTATTPVFPGAEGEPMFFDWASLAVGPDGAFHILVTKRLADSNVLSYFTNASGTWVEETFALCCGLGDPELRISDANVISATQDRYLRNDSGEFVDRGSFDLDARASRLVIAREIDLAYFLGAEGGPVLSIWTDDGACLTRRWTMSGCEPILTDLRLAVSPSGDRFVGLGVVEDQLVFTDFNAPAPTMVPVGTAPIEVMGGADIDATGRVHVGFWRSAEVGIVWASGFGPNDWQERTVPATFSDILPRTVHLAVNSDGSDIWLANSGSSLRIEHMQGDVNDPEHIAPFAPFGFGGGLHDMALGPDEQPVVVGDRNEPGLLFVAWRIGDEVWESEVFAEAPVPP